MSKNSSDSSLYISNHHLFSKLARSSPVSLSLSFDHLIFIVMAVVQIHRAMKSCYKSISKVRICYAIHFRSCFLFLFLFHLTMFVFLFLLFQLYAHYNIKHLNCSTYKLLMTGRRIFLHFEAVDSAFCAWINGVSVGYRYNYCMLTRDIFTVAVLYAGYNYFLSDAL